MKAQKKQAAELKGEHEVEAHVNDGPLLSHQVWFTKTNKASFLSALFISPMEQPWAPQWTPRQETQADTGWQLQPQVSRPVRPPAPQIHLPKQFTLFILDQHFPTALPQFA